MKRSYMLTTIAPPVGFREPLKPLDPGIGNDELAKRWAGELCPGDHAWRKYLETEWLVRKICDVLPITGEGRAGLTAAEVAAIHPRAVECVSSWSACFTFALPNGRPPMSELDLDDLRLFHVA